MVTDGPWVEQWLSPERFATYLRQAGNDRVRALDLHEWSAKMSAALLHDFAHLEVGIRNMYDAALMAAVVAGDRHWSNPASALVLFPDVARSDRRTHRDLEVARTAAGGLSAPGGKVLAELTFGFWVYLTSNRRSASIWTPYLQHAYPAGSVRTRIHSGLDELRKARNRVAHHEPIRVSEVNDLTRRVRRYARYVSSDLADYISETSDVALLLRHRP